MYASSEDCMRDFLYFIHCVLTTLSEEWLLRPAFTRIDTRQIEIHFSGYT